jgi:hypothetical protein
MVLMASCKPKMEDMRTGELPSPSTHEFPSTPDASRHEASDFKDIARDPDKFVEGLGSPPAGCFDPIIQKPVPPQEQKTLEDIIAHSYKNDPSCSTVFTGNGRKHWSDEKKSETPDISYARVMAYSMAQDMCEQNELSKVFEKRYGEKDALSSELFKDGTKKSVNDHASTYALIYALGQRESAGNFNQPRDPSRSNLGITEEAGLTQTSANSLNLKGVPKEIDGLMKRVFRNYVTKLSAMKNQQERASFCLSDKMAGNKQTKEITISGVNRFTSKKIDYDSQGSALQELFSTKESSCASITDEIQGDFIVHNKKLNMINCFKDLHKFCPGFSIKYGAAVARTQKNHHGPLRENQSKPAPRPSCHMLFNAIANGRDEICKELNISPKTDKNGIQTDVVPVVKNETLSKTETPITGVPFSTEIRTEPINPYLIPSPAVSLGGQPIESADPSATPAVLSSEDSSLLKNYQKLGGDPVAFEQAMCFLKTKGKTSFKSFGEGYRNGIKIENQRYVTIQDFTKPSSEKRLFMLDRETGKVEVLHSVHGLGVYPYTNSRELAKNFSNSSGSLKTPSGFFITGNTYNSTKSWRVGMRLHGLQKGINDKSIGRGVVLHGGPYVTEGVAKDSDSSPQLKGNTCGRSHGCTVVNSKQVKSVMSKLASGKEGRYPYRGGALFYNFSPLEKSKGPSYCGDRLVPEVSQ